MVEKHRRRITMSDVAAHAGVDVSVVSRVLSNDPTLRIRDETRRDVLRYVEELQYRPNMLARGLRTARSQMIGLILPDLRNPVYASIIVGAERAAARLDQVLLVGSGAGGQIAEERRNTILGSGRVDSLLVGGSIETGDLKPLLSTGLPFLLVNRRSKDFERSVVIDDARAAAMAVEHLVGLGHVRIGHIAGPTDVEPSRRRHAGYVAAMKAAKLPVKTRWTASVSLTPEGGAAALRRLLLERDAPTAVIVDSVGPAIGALEQARVSGLRVPRDLSVVGMHDIDLLQWIHPGLTTVRTPLEELGERAVQILHDTPGDTPIAEVIGEPLELIVRESTAPPGERS